MRAQNRSYRLGFSAGRTDGYNAGYQHGLDRHRVSIIIPSYNQKAYLAECLESIRAFTPEPHEIIVIDNGSTDGTQSYLTSLSDTPVRYRLLRQNLGFAGAVNQGLQMAKGAMLLFLNNDTVVTEHWLKRLLACVRGREDAGLVGPVTNYISGDQQIATDYGNIAEMHAFARAHNQRSDPEAWVETGRLIGYCVIMRREVFENLGYLDEGFAIGNCEDDDYALRARLLGYKLIIAFDAFIHHYGSVSMKALGGQFDDVYGRNLQFYSEKWGDPHGLLDAVRQKLGGRIARSVDFYPTHVCVRDLAGGLYWLEHGTVYPVESDAQVRAPYLADVDFRHWQKAGAITGELLAGKIAALEEPGAGGLRDGMLLQAPSGSLYQYAQGAVRRFHTDRSADDWQVRGRSPLPVTADQLSGLTEGLPILSPPVMKGLLAKEVTQDAT